MTYETLSLPLRRIIRSYCLGESKCIAIKGSRNISSVSHSTPVEVAPTTIGHPYLSTSFRNGSFCKQLYTPSTLAVQVGWNWLVENVFPSNGSATV